MQCVLLAYKKHPCPGQPGLDSTKKDRTILDFNKPTDDQVAALQSAASHTFASRVRQISITTSYHAILQAQCSFCYPTKALNAICPQLQWKKKLVFGDRRS